MISENLHDVSKYSLHEKSGFISLKKPWDTVGQP